MEDPDLQALRLIQQGDEQGLVDLMNRHREPLYRFIFRFVYNEADAAELTESTFLKVYKNAARFRPKAKVKTWMFAIAGNLCRDFLRKQRKRRGEFSLQTPLGQDSGFTIQDTFSDTAATPDEVANSNEKLATIEHAIDQLPHKLKLPFITCTLEGHSYDECAEIIGSNRKTVETRIYRARKMLQSQLSNL